MKKTSKIEDLVSVVIPIYGNFDERRLLLCVSGAMNQKGINMEVVVSEQGAFPRMKKLLPKNVKYVFKKHIEDFKISDYNPGQIRNIAIKNSKGNYIYTNDADILFLDKNYLANSINILKENPGVVLHRPIMKRLPLENFDEFWKLYSIKGVEGAISKLDKSHDYFAALDKKKREVKVIKRNAGYYEKTFVATIEDNERYLNDPSLKGKEPTIWSENLHCGGNLFTREQFDGVGGYCANFINWGCEDSDLQWKFLKKYDLRFFENSSNFTVMHQDHPKGYFSPEMWARNEKISAKRMQDGIGKAIKEDKANLCKLE